MREVSPESLIYAANTAGMSALPVLIRELERIAHSLEARKTKRRRVAARWAEDLVQWCRDRGIKSDTAIAKYLGVDRSTLWRWKQGGRVTDANADTIVEKTKGEIDPRVNGRRR
jgi:hypothetical protein